MPKDRLLFSKEGRARYISHLDLMRTFQRAFTRAELPIKHTEGFNPHPFISIALPLPLGFASECEFLEFELLPGPEHDQVPQRLNEALPEGVTVRACYPAQRPIKELLWLEYAIQVQGTGDIPGALTAWWKRLERESWVVEKPSKKAKSGVTQLDLIPMIKDIGFTEVENTGFTIHAVLAAQNPGLNPSVMLKAFMDECSDFCPELVNYRRVRALDGDGKEFR